LYSKIEGENMEIPCKNCKQFNECIKVKKEEIAEAIQRIQSQHIASSAWFFMNFIKEVFNEDATICDEFTEWLKSENLIDYPTDIKLN